MVSGQLWVLIDLAFSISGNYFSSTQGRVHPNEDASLHLFPAWLGKSSGTKSSHPDGGAQQNICLACLLPPHLLLLC